MSRLFGILGILLVVPYAFADVSLNEYCEHSELSAREISPNDLLANMQYRDFLRMANQAIVQGAHAVQTPLADFNFVQPNLDGASQWLFMASRTVEGRNKSTDLLSIKTKICEASDLLYGAFPRETVDDRAAALLNEARDQLIPLRRAAVAP